MFLDALGVHCVRHFTIHHTVSKKTCYGACFRSKRAVRFENLHSPFTSGSRPMERKSHADPVPQGGASLSLAELLAGFRRGRPLASAELVNRYGSELLHYARTWLSKHAPHTIATAEDVVQDTWLEVFKSLMRPRIFPDEASFVGFLHRITARCITHYYRVSKAANRSAHGEEPLDVTRHDQPGVEPEPAEVAAFADELRYAL